VPAQTLNPLTILAEGELDLAGEFVWGSNYTFLVKAALQDEEITGVYKPSRGERPLWDFPRASLAHREVAAYLVSEALGWKLVPATVYRPDGPAGAGSLQIYIEHDPNYHYFNFGSEDRQRLKPTVLFDYIINNADRKGSHLLVDPENRIWLIDHGICFHEEDKLRTVIWDFCGESIPPELNRDMQEFLLRLRTDTELLKELGEHLLPVEVSMLEARTGWLASASRFPNPPANRRAHPWPPV
jgi:hypothetical protein